VNRFDQTYSDLAFSEEWSLVRSSCEVIRVGEWLLNVLEDGGFIISKTKACGIYEKITIFGDIQLRLARF
jgi:hypothetical protein